MGIIRGYGKVKLVIGLIFQDSSYQKEVENIFVKRFGSYDYKSQILDFTYTEYYKNEFGLNLKRCFLSFKRLIPPDVLPNIKLYSNRVELKLSCNKKRKINIDPGYINDSKFVLATTKDFTHRIFLKDGIFAEVTLYFKNNSFTAYEWTYPDYKSKEYIAIFNEIRNIYRKQLG